jgi:hypothetical protein
MLKLHDFLYFWKKKCTEKSHTLKTNISLIDLIKRIFHHTFLEEEIIIDMENHASFN